MTGPAPQRTSAPVAPRAPAYASVAALRDLYRTRAASPVEVMQELYARIDRYESSLHCFVTQTRDIAFARARAAEKMLLQAGADALTGIPYGLKDVINTAGVLTTGQSKILEHNVPAHDAGVEACMRAAGGVLMGKLTTYEFAHGGPSWDLPWPPAMNPWKAGYLPGSTSSGPGAAVAAGLLPAAIGTDTGGSIRMPAANCGIVGLKPTYGLVSRRGVLPNTFTFDTCGPLTRSVEDAAIVLGAIAGYDDGDERCHPDVAPAVEQALKVFADAGAIVEEIKLSDLLVYQDCKTTISITEMFSAYEHEFRTRPQDFGLMFRNKVLSGALIRAEDYFQALRQRLWLARELGRAFKDFDVLATAGWMTPAEPAQPDQLDKFLRPPNITTPFNIGGQPAMNVPCGFSREGLPLSLQLAAAHFAEALLLRAGHSYQLATDWHLQHPTAGMIQ